MANGEGKNGNHSQLGYGSCDWGTGRVTVCPPGPEATRRLSLAGAVEGQNETIVKVDIAVHAEEMKMSLCRHQ